MNSVEGRIGLAREADVGNIRETKPRCGSSRARSHAMFVNENVRSLEPKGR